jgi:hypothetical protein
MRRRGPRPRDPSRSPPLNLASRKIAGVSLFEILDWGREMQRRYLAPKEHRLMMPKPLVVILSAAKNLSGTGGQERAAAPCPRADVLVLRNASVKGQASAAATGL